MTQDKAFQQNENEIYNLPKESWGLYLDFANHNLKDYIQYKNKVEWIEFYKCGEGYWCDYWNKNMKKRKLYFNLYGYDSYPDRNTPIKNLKMLKLFTNVKYISAFERTGFTYGQQKEIHKIIKKKQLKQEGIIGISRKKQKFNNKLGFMYGCTISPGSKYGYNREKAQVTMYNRGTGKYKYSIVKYYVVPKFWKSFI
jgi:hypothetical protein